MTIDFIPLPFYADIYHHVLLLITLMTFIRCQSMDYDDERNRQFLKIIGIFLIPFIIIYMGLRPISGRYFGDMWNYYTSFKRFDTLGYVDTEKDITFQYFMLYTGRLFGINGFFFIAAGIYTLSAYIVSKRWFKDYWFYAFLMLAGSFSFWAYGTNGIRNGLATAFFLIAISHKNIFWQLLWFYLAIAFHKTLMLPVAGFLATQFYNRPKLYYGIWLLAIPLSLAAPGLWETTFAGLIGDDRASGYLVEGKIDHIDLLKVGFRWDFLFYSAAGVVAGWYYIFKRGYNDRMYLRIYNTYLFANAFWILVIRANFSNRFAYLSWFLMALVIVYPWLKVRFTPGQLQKLGWIIVAHYAFTYFMNVIVY